MSYHSGRSSYSGLGSSYSSYTPSYDSYSRSSTDSWRKYSSPSYNTKTYDFGGSSFLSKSYGSDKYSRKYDEYSWKAKDLLTDNPFNKELDVQLPETGKLKYEHVNEEDMAKDEYVTADIKNEGSDASKDDTNKNDSSTAWYKSVDEDSTKYNTRDDDSSGLSSKGYSSYTQEKYSYREDNTKFSSKTSTTSVEDSTKDNTRDDVSDLSSKGYSSYTRGKYSYREDNTKYSSKTSTTSVEDSTKDNTRDDGSRDLSSKGYLSNSYTNRDSYKDYSSKMFSKEEDFTRNDDVSGDIIIRGSGKKSTFSDHKSNKDGEVRNGDLDINMNFTKYKLEKELTNDKLLVRDTTHEKPAASPKKKVYNFEEDDDDVFVKPEENQNTLSAEKETIFDEKKNQPSTSLQEIKEELNHSRHETPNTVIGDRYSTSKTRQDTDKPIKKGSRTANRRFVQIKESKTSRDVTDSAGPLRIHRQGITKFISAVPDEKLYVSSVNFLPDRIELRFCGAPPKEKKLRKCRSITDLYEITVRPQGQQDLQQTAKHPWEDTIQCTQQDFSYSYDSENEILHFTKTKHEHNKEMYITQYTHHFNSDEPRTHIAGWKVDYEPNGIPHEKSRMCVVRSPVVGDSRRRVPRPKSAPPQLFRPANTDGLISPSQKVAVVERGSYSLPRRANRLPIPDQFIYSQKVDVVDQGNYTSTDAQRAGNNLDIFFQSSMDDSQTEDASSVGYAPSDDTSDSSAFFFNDPRVHSRHPYEKQHSDSGIQSFGKPRLIRLSAEFPGIRNLEKIRRKRQSMGSASSDGNRSSVGGLSPSSRNGEYGFFVALTSGDPRNPQRMKRYSYT